MISRAERKGPPVSVRPYPVKLAVGFVRDVHRRLPRVVGGMWCVAAVIGGDVVGVAVVGRPTARLADDGLTLEVTRVAVRDGAVNAATALYGACSRAARAMGAADLFTTVHGDESGNSLKWAGWVRIGVCGGGEWSRDGRQRAFALDPEPKVKWAAQWGAMASARR